uniref:Uncharacterized protein n=1 Tax=Trichogramma kaykai TaxID=54128 RepID=A0ABD2WNY7_9HYME
MIRARRPRNDRPPFDVSLTCAMVVVCGPCYDPWNIFARVHEMIEIARDERAIRSAFTNKNDFHLGPINHRSVRRTFGCRIGWRGVGGGGGGDSDRAAARPTICYAPCVARTSNHCVLLKLTQNDSLIKVINSLHYRRANWLYRAQT